MLEKRCEFIWKFITDGMEAKGMSVADLSRASGLSYPAIKYIVDGKVDCRLSTLDKVATGLGVTLDNLLGIK